MEDLRRRADRAAQARRWQEERCAQTDAEIAALAERATTLQASFAAFEQAVGFGTGRRQCRPRPSWQPPASDELLQELAERRAAAAEAQGHLRSQQALLDNTLRSRQAIADQIAAKQRQIAGLEQEMATLGEQVAVLRGQENDLSSQIAMLQAQIDPLEAQLQILDTSLAEEQAQERTLQAALRREETAWNTAQLHLQRSQDLLEQLRGEIQQDLGPGGAGTE